MNTKPENDGSKEKGVAENGTHTKGDNPKGDVQNTSVQVVKSATESVQQNGNVEASDSKTKQDGTSSSSSLTEEPPKTGATTSAPIHQSLPTEQADEEVNLRAMVTCPSNQVQAVRKVTDSTRHVQKQVSVDRPTTLSDTKNEPSGETSIQSVPRKISASKPPKSPVSFPTPNIFSDSGKSSTSGTVIPTGAAIEAVKSIGTTKTAMIAKMLLADSVPNRPKVSRQQNVDETSEETGRKKSIGTITKIEKVPSLDELKALRAASRRMSIDATTSTSQIVSSTSQNPESAEKQSSSDGVTDLKINQKTDSASASGLDSKKFTKSAGAKIIDQKQATVQQNSTATKKETPIQKEVSTAVKDVLSVKGNVPSVQNTVGVDIKTAPITSSNSCVQTKLNVTAAVSGTTSTAAADAQTSNPVPKSATPTVIGAQSSVKDGGSVTSGERKVAFVAGATTNGKVAGVQSKATATINPAVKLVVEANGEKKVTQSISTTTTEKPDQITKTITENAKSSAKQIDSTATSSKPGTVTVQTSVHNAGTIPKSVAPVTTSTSPKEVVPSTTSSVASRGKPWKPLQRSSSCITSTTASPTFECSETKYAKNVQRQTAQKTDILKPAQTTEKPAEAVSGNKTATEAKSTSKPTNGTASTATTTIQKGQSDIRNTTTATNQKKPDEPVRLNGVNGSLPEKAQAGISNTSSRKSTGTANQTEPVTTSTADASQPVELNRLNGAAPVKPQAGTSNTASTKSSENATVQNAASVRDERKKSAFSRIGGSSDMGKEGEEMDETKQSVRKVSTKTLQLQDQTNTLNTKKTLGPQKSVEKPPQSTLNKENRRLPDRLPKHLLTRASTSKTVNVSRHSTRFPSDFEVRIKLKKLERTMSNMESSWVEPPQRKVSNISNAAQQLMRDISRDDDEPPKRMPLMRTRSAVFSRSLSRQNSMTFVFQLSPQLNGLPEDSVVRICKCLSYNDVQSLSHVCRTLREKIIRNRRQFERLSIDELRFDYKWSFAHYPLPPFETWADVLVDAKCVTVSSYRNQKVITCADIESDKDFEHYLRVFLPSFAVKALKLNDLSEEFLLLLVRGIAGAGWGRIESIQLKDTWKTMSSLTKTKILAVTRSRRLSILAADEVINRRYEDFSSLSGLESPCYSSAGSGCFSVF